MVAAAQLQAIRRGYTLSAPNTPAVTAACIEYASACSWARAFSISSSRELTAMTRLVELKGLSGSCSNRKDRSVVWPAVPPRRPATPSAADMSDRAGGKAPAPSPFGISDTRAAGDKNDPSAARSSIPNPSSNESAHPAQQNRLQHPLRRRSTGPCPLWRQQQCLQHRTSVSMVT